MAANHSQSEAPQLPTMTESEKHRAFEWLRQQAMDNHDAYVALRAWSELKALQSATAPSAWEVAVATAEKCAQVCGYRFLYSEDNNRHVYNGDLVEAIRAYRDTLRGKHADTLR